MAHQEFLGQTISHDTMTNPTSAEGLFRCGAPMELSVLRGCNILELPWSVRGQNHLGLQQWASSPNTSNHMHPFQNWPCALVLRGTFSLTRSLSGNFFTLRNASRKPQWPFESGHFFPAVITLRSFSSSLKILFF